MHLFFYKMDQKNFSKEDIKWILNLAILIHSNNRHIIKPDFFIRWIK